jgi:glutamine amidotransferase
MIILPGVGAFAEAMANLRTGGLDAALREQTAKGVPTLGICLGMQLLASSSTEGGWTAGLGLIPGEVLLLDGQRFGHRVPHIGWNDVARDRDEPLLHGMPPETNFYFVHSYHFRPADPRASVATTPYCGQFTSIVRRGNVVGTQFHPEKSQRAGFQLLTNFLGQ